MKNTIKKYKKNKLLITLIIVIILSVTIGLLFPSLLSNSSKKLLISTLDNFFINIKNNNLNYTSSLISTLFSNILILSLIWIFGISIIGSVFIVIVLFIKSFILGFSISSILLSYKLNGLILSIIYVIPLILNLLIYFVLCYYSIDFSIILFNYLFKKRNNIHKKTVKRYIKIYIFSLLLIILSSLVEVYIVPNIINIFI
ncbi:MAG: stage II sporulation protein M [Bacilli bacterium]|nr:stage II sporulation protein M [Bacilli bacterium]